MIQLGIRGAASWTESEGPGDLSLLKGSMRRRASPITKACAHVMAPLRDALGLDLSAIPTVYASNYGEMQITVGLLAMMHEDDGSLSPSRFSNSVHNAASGHLSIACGNTGFSSAVAGGPSSLAMALIEAAGLLHAGAEQVLLVAAELPRIAPFDTEHYPGLSAALLLAADGPLVLGDLRQAPVDPERVAPPELELSPELAANPTASALTLARAVERGWTGSVQLTCPRAYLERGWWAELSASGA